MYSDYTPKKIKSKRIFNLLDPNCQRIALICSAVAVAFTLFAFMGIDTDHTPTVAFFCAVPIIMILTVISIVMINKPKVFEILGDRIEFSTYIRLSVPSEYGSKRIFPRVKVYYTITDAKIISFGQSSLERTFDTGHMVFTGKITFTSDKYLDEIPEKSSFTVYGIKEFSKAKTIIEDQIKNGRKESYYD